MSSAEPAPAPPARRLVLWIALPMAVLFGILAGGAGFVEGGLTQALQLGALSFVGTMLSVGGLVGLIGLVHVLASTRGGADPLGDPRQGYTLELDLGGTPQSAWDRVQTSLLALAGAKVVRSDRDAGELEVRCDGREFGNLAQHVVTATFTGTTVRCRVRHDPTRKPLDFGTTRKQAAALFARLQASVEPGSEGEAEPSEQVRRPTRVDEPGP